VRDRISAAGAKDLLCEKQVGGKHLEGIISDHSDGDLVAENKVTAKSNRNFPRTSSLEGKEEREGKKGSGRETLRVRPRSNQF